jgi:hypothetical protein
MPETAGLMQEITLKSSPLKADACQTLPKPERSCGYRKIDEDKDRCVNQKEEASTSQGNSEIIGFR